MYNKKSNRILYIVGTILVVSVTTVNYVSAYPQTVYTPNENPVSGSIHEEFDDDDIITYNADFDDYVDRLNLTAVRVDDASNTYNCHAFAWYYFGQYDPVEPVWPVRIEKPAYLEFINDESYVPCNNQVSPPHGARVAYFYKDHSAIAGYWYWPTLTFFSKWGIGGPLYWHLPGHDLYYFGDTDPEPDDGIPGFTYYCPNF